MRLLYVLTLLGLLAAAQAVQWSPSPEELRQMIGREFSTRPGDIADFRIELVRRLRGWAESMLPPHMLRLGASGNAYPYFHFIPVYLGAAIPGGAPVQIDAPCFQTTTVQALPMDAATSTVPVLVNAQNATSLLCSDMYLFSTIDSIAVETYMLHGSYNLTWAVNATDPHRVWDVQTKGVRVFRFLDDALTSLSDLVTTLALFESEATRGVPDSVAAVNIDFMTKYTGFAMNNRSVQSVPVDKNLIKSGDFFGVIRLDGLDPMLAWAMGSSTGHTTVALWIGGELYICESTALGSYWPVNGVQKTPYDLWIQQAREASFQVVWAPLAPELSASFNVTAAIELFETVEGLDYGYRTLLWGWLDTVKDNYPCLPPDYSQCLSWHHVELLFGLIDRLAPAAGDLLFNEALNKRVNTTGLDFAGVMYTMGQLGLQPETLPTIPEQDAWDYLTTRYDAPYVGKSMVCCVFVCNVWKAGGIFDAIGRDVNCGELTNWDDYSLQIFDSHFQRPPQCVLADPCNPLCQLEGQYTLTLNDFNTRKMHPWMAQSCPSLPPHYHTDPMC